MLPANLISTLKAIALTDRPLITALPDKGSASPAKSLEVGQQVQGTVQAQIAPNVYRVQVANQLLQMQLPAFVRSGDIVTLQVVSLQPRLTFRLAASENPVSTPESLSGASRLLSSLSQQPLERSYVRPLHSAPLWTGETPLPDIPQLANKLHDALSHSGLFYESHQAQWIAGNRPTAQLLQEPQNQIMPKPTVRAGTPNVSVQPAALPENAPETLSLPGPLATSSAGGKAEHSALPNIPPHLQTLVQQQLGALETHQVLWQGPVWAGQEMRWEVREESPRHTPQGLENGQWVTQISLDLPRLGGLSARLSLNGNALSLAVDVADPATQERLRKATAQLSAALAKHGISVLQTKIEQHGNAGT